jgi:hypothetical protein
MSSDSSEGSGCIFGVVVFVGLCIWGGNAAKNYYDQAEAAKVKASSTPAVPTPIKCSSDHRFEKLEVYPIDMRADIALDTCTGQVCRTWSWSPKRPGTAWDTYQFEPLCSELAKQ